MPNILQVEAANPDLLLNAGAYGPGAVIRVQTATSDSGPFSDVSGSGSTPTIALIAGTTGYVGYDPGGTSTSWYRTRYENVGATRLSDWTAPFQVGLNRATAVGRYASLLPLKARLGITDSTQDALLQDLCDQANGYLETRLERVVAPLPGTTFLFDGYAAIEGRKLWVPQGIRTVSLLEVAPSTNGTFQTVLSTNFFLRPLISDLPSGWPFLQIVLSDLGSNFFLPGYANIRVTGTFGWAAIPDELTGLAERLVVFAWRGRASAGGQNFNSGTDGERLFDAAMTVQDWQMVGRYSTGPWAR